MSKNKIYIGGRGFVPPFRYDESRPAAILDSINTVLMPVYSPVIGQYIADALNDAASLRAENERLREALAGIIETLYPSVGYTGVQVIWSAADREWTRKAINKARKVLEGKE